MVRQKQCFHPDKSYIIIKVAVVFFQHIFVSLVFFQPFYNFVLAHKRDFLAFLIPSSCLSDD